MASIAHETINGLTGYYVRDEGGRVIAAFDKNGDSLYGTPEKHVVSQPRRGKSCAVLPCELPAGYSVFCIIDHDANRIFFIVVAPGRVLSTQFPSPVAAISAAFADADPESKPEAEPEPDSEPGSTSSFQI